MEQGLGGETSLGTRSLGFGEEHAGGTRIIRDGLQKKLETELEERGPGGLGNEKNLRVKAEAQGRGGERAADSEGSGLDSDHRIGT